MTRDDSAAMVPFADVLESLDIAYFIGGSVASSTHGVGRSTQDIDIVARIRREHVPLLVERLGSAYYIDASMIQDAIRSNDSFNIIHLLTMQKIDVFMEKPRRFDQGGWDRIVRGRPFEDLDREFPLAAAEDVILNKLEWYRLGDEVSERQWNDVIGVMKVQGPLLDRAYLLQWAAELNVRDLLERAWREVDR